MAKQGKVRLQIEVSPEIKEELEQRVKEKGFPTVAELIRKDLAVAREVDRKLAEGYQLIKEEGGQQSIVQFIDWDQRLRFGKMSE